MKTILFLLLSISAYAQCKKIQINHVDLIELGNCTYKMVIYGYQLGGNPSIKPYYRCGDRKKALPCIDLLGNKIHTTPPFTCPCDVPVYISIVGYASENCHGDTCNAYQLSPLALIIPDKETKEKTSKIVYNSLSRTMSLPDNFESVEVFNLYGQPMFRAKVSKEITLPQMTAGAYYVRASTRYRSEMLTIIIH